MRCRVCGRENRPDARFCDGCGAAADEVAAPLVVEGERRQITVLFCDLVDSVSLSTRLDPEDFGRLMQRYEAAGQRAVDEFGGHIAQYLGDGLIVYFGYPQGHERAAEMAVRAGLALLENVARVDDEIAEGLAVRVAIHTGEAVVQPMGRGDRRDPLALGDVVNIAARAQSLAEPGSVAITGTTLRLVEGMFAVDSLGFPAMKGVASPLEILRVLGSEGDRAPVTNRILTPFVGRGKELAQLEGHWARARNGHGQVVHISGEPGIGKSRLVDELRQGLAGEDHVWLECGGAPHRQHTPFATVGEMTAHAFGWKPDRPDAARLDDLDAGLTAAGLDPDAVSPLLAPMLALTPEPGRYPAELRSAEQQREDLQTAMVRWLLSVAAARPLVVLTEDLHWLDPSSLELLERMSRAIVEAPVLMIQTARPEYVSPLAPADHHARLTIPPLDDDDVLDLVSQLVGDRRDSDAVAKIAARGDGVPLFVEEVLRSAGDDGEIATVPTTLRDALAARLDRLGTAKTIAQTASVCGMEFSSELLADVAEIDTDELAEALNRLVGQGITRVVGTGQTGVYQFSHALLQETAYASLLRTRRQELHDRVVETLSERSPALVVLRPELLAHHLGGAGRVPEAIAAWERAASHAFAASAMVEAESHVDTAISLLGLLPEDDERAASEMRLQILLGRVCSATHGMASERVRSSYARALDLGASFGDSSRLIGLLFGAWGGAFSHGDITEAERHLAELVRVSSTVEDASMMGWVAYAEAATVFAHGDLQSADRLLDRIFGDDRHAAGDANFGLDLAVIALTHRALVAWNLGRITEAVAWIDGCLPRAEATSPWELAMALMASCCLFIRMRDPERVRADANRLRTIAEDAALPTFLAWADLYRGWAMAEQGEVDAGVESMRAGLAGYLATEQRTGHPGYLAWIAGAQLRGGDPAAALVTITQAERALPEEVVDVPGIWQTRGAILEADPALAAGDETAASCYERAIETARQLGSVMLELEGATRLAALRQRAGDVTAGRALVEPLLGRVVGGDDIPDVLDARSVVQAG
jgi:class 3 adenylate cyclase